MIDKHDGEGRFPTFSAGEAVHNLKPCDESVHWVSCTIQGMDTYIPDFFIKDDILTREYNPTELIVNKDETIEVEAIAYEWLYAKSANGIYGWVPAEKVISVSLKG